MYRGYKRRALTEHEYHSQTSKRSSKEQHDNNIPLKMMSLQQTLKKMAKSLMSSTGIWGFGDIGREEEFRINGGSS